MWTVANLVDRLSDEYDFAVVCRNHDGAGDRAAYKEAETNAWNDVGAQKVFYVDPSTFSKRQAARLVRDFGPDMIFMNSVFGLTTRMPLEARRKDLIPDLPVIVAPCGELSDQCLSIKPFKKGAFLKYAKLLRLYRGVIWKATSELEAAEIRRLFGDEAAIAIAPDLVPDAILPDFRPDNKSRKHVGSVRIVSVARIAPKKNITYLLERLAECGTGNFELELIGGVDDQDYWHECELLIQKLPPNIEVTISGAIAYSDVLARLINSHFFVLPTLNENFGYVFVEAMSAGCPILVSENTIWNGVEGAECGWVVRLDRPGDWVANLERFAEMGDPEFTAISARARKFALNWLASSGDAAANRRVFASAIASQKVNAR